MAFLELEGVEVKFGEFLALRDIDLAVSEGNLVCLLGPSGCGKTTTLRVIAGFVLPDRGKVCVKGRDYTNLPPYRRNMGIVFQNYALFPHLTVFENVAFGLRMRHLPADDIRRKVAGALSLVNLRGMERRYPLQLSGGQQQRVALARALVINPDVLLLDEPLSNLDAMLRIRMRSEIKRLQRQTGITSLFVTHDQDECFSIADKVVIVREGTIVQVGTPEEILDRPRNRFVAEFIGFENALKVRPSYQAAGGLALTSVTGGVEFPASLVRGLDERVDRADEIEVVFKAEDACLVAPESEAAVLKGRIAICAKQGRRDVYIVDSLVGELKVSGSETMSWKEGDVVGVTFRPGSFLALRDAS